MSGAIRGICFDLWNTLATTDHEPHPMHALAEAFGLAGAPGWRRTLEKGMMARPFSGISAALDALEKTTGRAPSAGWTRRNLIMMWGAASNGNRFFSDAEPALRRLSRSGYRTAIVSNTQSFDLDFLRRGGLEARIDATCFSFECGLLKPDPALFHLAASRLRLPPGQLLMVGDNLEDDVRGARAAGFRSVLLDRAARIRPAGEDALHGLDDLVRRLERGDPFTAL